MLQSNNVGKQIASNIDNVSNVSALRCRQWKELKIYDRDI